MNKPYIVIYATHGDLARKPTIELHLPTGKIETLDFNVVREVLKQVKVIPITINSNHEQVIDSEEVVKNFYSEEDLIIKDDNVIKRLCSKIVTHINKHKGLRIIAGSLALSTVAGSIAGSLAKEPKSSTDLDTDLFTKAPIEDLSNISMTIPTKLKVDNSEKLIIIEDEPQKEELAVVQDIPIEQDVPTTTTEEFDNLEIYTMDVSEKSQKEKILEYARKHYGDSLARYSSTYGLPEDLITAMVCQENPYNIDTSAARGVSQIENVNWGTTYAAFNFDTYEFDNFKIDESKLYDPDYAIKIACAILNYNYRYLRNRYVDDGTLTDNECILAAVQGYNQGVYGIEGLIQKYGTDYLNHRDELQGDPNYLEHVFAFIEDGKLLLFQNDKSLSPTSIIVDNTNDETYTSTTSR